MATYSPPATPTLDPDMREDLLRWLDEEIMATQNRHDEAQRQLRKRRKATSYQPDQFENALHEDETPSNAIPGESYTCSFNLTGIMPPQPPKWKQVNHLYEDFKKFQRSCTRVFEGPMAHVSDKVKVNMLLLWCGPDMEKTYTMDSIWMNNMNMIWSLYGHCLIIIVNPYATFELRDGNFGL